MPGDVEMIITSEGDNGILFEGTEGRFFVNRGKLAGKPVEELKDKPLPEGRDRKGLRRQGQREPHRQFHRGDEVPQAADLRRLVA